MDKRYLTRGVDVTDGDCCCRDTPTGHLRCHECPEHGTGVGLPHRCRGMQVLGMIFERWPDPDGGQDYMVRVSPMGAVGRDLMERASNG